MDAEQEKAVRENALHDIRFLVNRGDGLGNKYAALLLAELDRRESEAKAQAFEEAGKLLADGLSEDCGCSAELQWRCKEKAAALRSKQDAPATGDRCSGCGGKVIVHGDPASVGQTGWYQPVYDSAAKSPCSACGRGYVVGKPAAHPSHEERP